MFTREHRDLYKSITRNPPPTFDLEVVLTIPELSPNQAVVYLPPDASRARLEPTPDTIVLEVWTVTLSGPSNYGVTPPIVYRHGMVLFRSIYTLLRTLPAWSLYKRIRRRTGGLARTGALSVSLRLRHSVHDDPASSTSTLAFGTQPSSAISPIPTLTQAFPPVQLPPGTLEFSVTYLATPYFQIDELESVLSSRFISADLNAGEGFVPTLNKSLSRQSSPPSVSNMPRNRPLIVGTTKEQSESIAERFILPSKAGPLPNSSSPRDPLARLRKESVSVHTSAGPSSPTNSPRQRKQSLNSNSSPSSSIMSQGGQTPFLANSVTTGVVGFPTINTNNTTTTTTSAPGTTTTTSPLPIRRPNINPVHPFKSNTLSSPSNSSPSVSLRTGGGGGPSSLSNQANTSHPPIPVAASASSPLSTTTNLGGGGQPSSVSSTHSHHSHVRHVSLGGGGSRPPPSPIITGFAERERERRMSSLSTMSTAERERERALSAIGMTGAAVPQGDGLGTGGETSPVPVPGRKRYSSSFGKRYTVGGAGGGTAGSTTGSGPTSAAGSAGTGGGGAIPGISGAGGTGGAGTGTPEIKPVSSPVFYIQSLSRKFKWLINPNPLSDTYLSIKTKTIYPFLSKKSTLASPLLAVPRNIHWRIQIHLYLPTSDLLHVHSLFHVRIQGLAPIRVQHVHVREEQKKKKSQGRDRLLLIHPRARGDGNRWECYLVLDSDWPG